MAIRSFKLTNKNGVVWDLNSPDSFFHDVEGFGHELEFNFVTAGNSFFEISREFKQPKPSVIILFSDYKKCNDFTRFLQANPFTLEYTMPGINTSYYIPLEIERFRKGEMKNGSVPCDIDFSAITLYYKSIISESEISASVGKEYPYTYPYTYRDKKSGEVVLQSDSDIDSPCKLSIFGPCDSPSWIHYLNGVIKTRGKLNCTIGTGERIVVDTTKIPYTIKKYDMFMNELEGCYSESDFSTERFVLLGFGENKISFTHEGAEQLNIIGEGRILYESV